MKVVKAEVSELPFKDLWLELRDKEFRLPHWNEAYSLFELRVSRVLTKILYDEILDRLLKVH